MWFAKVSQRLRQCLSSQVIEHKKVVHFGESLLILDCLQFSHILQVEYSGNLYRKRYTPAYTCYYLSHYFIGLIFRRSLSYRSQVRSSSGDERRLVSRTVAGNKRRGCMSEILKRIPKRFPDPVLWAWLEIISAMRGKTTHLLTLTFFSSIT